MVPAPDRLWSKGVRVRQGRLGRLASDGGLPIGYFLNRVFSHKYRGGFNSFSTWRLIPLP
jgi:hypothetical protein